VTATPSTSRLINGVVYSPAQIGKVTGKVELSNPSVFLGVGYDSAHRSRPASPIACWPASLSGSRAAAAPEAVRLTIGSLLKATPASRR